MLAIGAAAFVNAQYYPVRPPLAPTDLSPAAGDYEGKIGNLTPLTLMWSQYVPSGGGLTINPVATHFVICFDPSTAPACTVTSAGWTETIAAPSSALSRTGNRFSFNPGRYVAASELDAPMRLTVGACSQLLNQSCRFTGVDLYFSSRNPIASRTPARNDAAVWTLDMLATNSGTSDVPAMTGTVEYWEVLGYGNPGRDCRRDVDASDLVADMTAYAFDINGAHSLVPLLPRQNGTYNGPAIVGIYRLGNAYDMQTFTSTTILANQSRERAIGVANFPVAATAGQRTFVVVARIDTNSVVREFNEKDNAVGQCKKR